MTSPKPFFHGYRTSRSSRLARDHQSEERRPTVCQAPIVDVIEVWAEALHDEASRISEFAVCDRAHFTRAPGEIGKMLRVWAGM